MRRPRNPVRSLTTIGVVIGLAAAVVGAGAAADASPRVCVGGPGCFSTVQAAVDAAEPGAVITVAPGTYRGGITIGKSLTLAGAGAPRTTLKGGDSVVRVASPGGQRPSVTISGVTITGGVARGDGVEARGGGVLVEGAGAGLGASVVLRRVVVSGNRAEPTRTSPSPSGVACPGGDCPYALTAGGGIASFGTLVLDHSSVRGNAATGRASDAQGGGIWTARGHLTVLASTVTGNRAEPKAIGRYAEGGGVFTSEADTGAASIPLTISRSRIDGNGAVMYTSWPIRPSAGAAAPIDMSVNAGGLHIGSGYATTIDRTTIDGNRVVAVDPVGEPLAVDSGVIQVNGGTFSLTRSSVDGNSAKLVAATADDVLTSGSAIEVDGAATISDTTISRNTASAVGTAGSAYVSNGLGVFAFKGSQGSTSLERVAIIGNTATARSSTGAAHVFGAGVLNNSLLTMSDTVVAGNRGTAVSTDGVAQGGGIWNGVLLSGPPVTLAVHRSAITGNSVTARDGAAKGGGIFNAPGAGVTLSRDRTLVSGNAPDQCAGCTANPAPAGSAQSAKTAPSSTEVHARPAH